VAQTLETDGVPSEGEGVPAITFTLRAHVDEVRDDGSARLSFEFADVRAEPTPEASPGARAAVDLMLAQVRFTLRLDLTNRGQATFSAVEVPENVPGPAREIVDGMASQMKESLGQVAVLLPEPAVGVGAAWKVVQKEASEMGFELTATGTYRVKSLVEGVATLELAASVEAPEQDLALPDMPPDRPARLLALSGEGTGRIVVDPRVVLPEAEFSLTVDTRMSLDAGTGTPMRLAIKQTLTLSMRTKP